MFRFVFVLLGMIMWFVPAKALHGPVHGLHPKLVKNLKKMERAFGRKIQITPHGGCRRKASRAAPRSYHLHRRGCKAADIVIRGISKRRILAWWKRHVGGGTGYYCGRPFVHVDVGPKRHWTWFCGRRR